MYLVSVKDDNNSHGEGALRASQSTVYVEGILAIVDGDSASADLLCLPLKGAHCAPAAAQGSESVFIESTAVHADGMARACGASTVVTGQGTVYIGDVVPFVEEPVEPESPEPEPIPKPIRWPWLQTLFGDSPADHTLYDEAIMKGIDKDK